MAGREGNVSSTPCGHSKSVKLISDGAFHLDGQRPHFFDLEIIAFIINSSFMARTDKMVHRLGSNQQQQDKSLRYVNLRKRKNIADL